MLQMSQTERDCIKFSDLRIKSIVIDQWKLFAHYRVRQETHKNIGLTKLFNVLGNRRYQVKFDALHRLSKYAIHLKQKMRRRKIAHQLKLTPEQRYERLALGLDVWGRHLRA